MHTTVEPFTAVPALTDAVEAALDALELAADSVDPDVVEARADLTVLLALSSPFLWAPEELSIRVATRQLADALADALEAVR